MSTAQRRAHARARERGVSPLLYRVVRLLMTPLLRVWFGLRVSGSEHLPAEGPAIIAANHKSFLDPFFIGLATWRHLRYMAKAEIFWGPLGWLFARLGAFPVRRGRADPETLKTARAILDRGGIVIVFPEGTRVDEPDALGSPHHGAGTLAVETGAPIVPTAISGTSHLWLGPIPKPRRVRVAFAPAVDVAELPAGERAFSDLIDREVWPAVQREYGRLRMTSGLLAVGLAAIGVGGLIGRRNVGRVRLLGIVEPPKARRRKALRRLLKRLRVWRRR